MSKKQLVAVDSVVLKVNGKVRTFDRAAPLPALGADEAARLLRLGAAREAVMEAEAKAPKLPPDDKVPGTGDGPGDKPGDPPTP